MEFVWPSSCSGSRCLCEFFMFVNGHTIPELFLERGNILYIKKKIDSLFDFQLVYWDDRSLFLEHEVITLRDGKVRSILTSRQHAIGRNGDSIEALLSELTGSQVRPSCPEYIEHWLRSMEISSLKLKKTVKSS